MWQDAKEIITRRMRAIAESFTFRHCLCPHKQSVHIICSKRDCKSFVKTQTKAVRFSKLRMPQWFVGTRTIWSELGMPQTRTL